MSRASELIISSPHPIPSTSLPAQSISNRWKIFKFQNKQEKRCLRFHFPICWQSFIQKKVSRVSWIWFETSATPVGRRLINRCRRNKNRTGLKQPRVITSILGVVIDSLDFFFCLFPRFVFERRCLTCEFYGRSQTRNTFCNESRRKMHFNRQLKSTGIWCSFGAEGWFEAGSQVKQKVKFSRKPQLCHIVRCLLLQQTLMPLLIDISFNLPSFGYARRAADLLQRMQ